MPSAGVAGGSRGCSLLTPKENQKSASDFDALEPRKRGCSPLLTPKQRATPEKTEDLLTVFSGSADLKPLSRCATAPPGGASAAAAVSRYDPSCEKANLENPQIFQICEIKNNSSAEYAQQRRRPPPVAETGRSCWGSGQQDASAAQGTKRMLGAATRKQWRAF